ncbi:MAG TPA: STAS domain-containing protein [Thermoanaerobaculia bacterium]|jgi:anti-anti-sigma factor|nr:STAS domain-containing protein [Thermoanaerobaculia bacterium]
MTESLKVRVDRRDGLAVVITEGYINNQGGEQIAQAANGLIEEGYRTLLLNLAGSKIVNSIGISILIEVLERVLELKGKLAFCNLTPTIQKTFHIMGLTQYAQVYPDEPTAVAELVAPASPPSGVPNSGS